MNPYYELPSLGNAANQNQVARHDRPGHALDEDVSVGTLRAVEAVEWAIEKFVDWRARRRAVAELQGLGDHTLADIGVDRSQIRSLVNEIVETGQQPAGRRARSWHRAAVNDNETASKIATLGRIRA